MIASPPSSQAAGSSAPLTTGTMTSHKIRDSCQACALSKVKCKKEKPTCSRCARRAITCQYLFTKRPGRKRDSSINVVPDLPEGQRSWVGTADLSIAPPEPGSASGLDCSSTSDMYSDALLPLESSISSTAGEMVSEFDRFYTPSMDDIFELGTLDVIDFAQEYNDMEKLLIPDSMDLSSSLDTSSLDRLSASKPSSPSSNGNSLSSSTSYTNVAGADTTLNATCNCLMLAFEFMKKFSSAKPAVYSFSSSRPNIFTALTTSHNGTPPAQVVVIENKQTIEAVSDILQCSCAEDASLLIMLAMIVFKILGRYTTAAGTQLGQTAMDSDTLNKKPFPPSSYFADDERGRIAAAQMILSELHHVQRLVNQLSPRLKTRAAGAGKESDGRFDGKDTGGDTRMSLESIEPTTATFSGTTLDQIEIDLRRCLSTLSSEIINVLRQS